MPALDRLVRRVTEECVGVGRRQLDRLDLAVEHFRGVDPIGNPVEDLKGEMSKQKEHRELIFAQEMSSMKDRERLLEEKFKEALKRADTDSGTPYKNPLDLD